ncbi:sphingomyelin synthase-related protein 1-like protein, partial [Dinothrombium tinctorium]
SRKCESAFRNRVKVAFESSPKMEKEAKSEINDTRESCDQLPDSVEQWSTREVLIWLRANNFYMYSELFESHKIDGISLLLLTEDDLKKNPFKMEVLGDIKRLYFLIYQLQQNNACTFRNLLRHSSKKFNSRSNRYFLNEHEQRVHRDSISRDSDLFSLNEEIDSESNLREVSHQKDLKPEAWKALVSMIYFFSVTWITAIVMVIVHDRVPDMQTYPPLPDIFLDNVPLIPWAFTMCELCGLILFITWSTILLFHKHRFILLRRMFSLFGSVFLLRCVTMMITSLSVPGRHLQCKARPYGNWTERLHQAYVIWQGGGMSIQGVRTCGDYMFSGHTVVLTLLNFFITEYTPPRLYYIHTLSWVLNLFGIFFILAAHEHYSIDVFIAFYISTRLFLYYHTLANNRALKQGDRMRTRIWFPLFYFFESGVDGIVPNQFEYPFKTSFFLSWKEKLEKKYL